MPMRSASTSGSSSRARPDVSSACSPRSAAPPVSSCISPGGAKRVPPPGMSEQRLRQLLRDCLVQIDSTDGRPAGSGFFVAPGYVITCSHVVNRPARARSPDNGTAARGRARSSMRARLRRLARTARTTRGHDLAGARPRRYPAGKRHRTSVRPAWLRRARGGLAHGSGRPASPFGDVPGDFSSATMEYTGKFLYLMRLKNEKFGRGMSGGPVLDLTNGEVCGVAKLAGPEQDGLCGPHQPRL